MADQENAPVSVPANLDGPPQAVVMLGGQPWTLRADFRAFYEVERHTGRSIHAIIQDQQEDDLLVYSLAAELVWALSATWRAKHLQGASFEDVLDLLPSEMRRFQPLSQTVFDLVTRGIMGAAVPGNPEEPVPEAEPAPE